MHIVIDGRLILPYMTGVGRYLVGLVGALSDLSVDEQFELWLSSDLPEDHIVWKLASERLAIRRLPASHMDLSASWVIPLELNRTQPDLLHYPHFDLPWTTLGEVVATIYDLKYLVHPEYFPRSAAIKRLLITAMMAFTLRRAKYIITTSKHTQQDLLDRFNISPGKLRAISLGVDERFFEKYSTREIEKLRHKYGFSKRIILFVGERRPHKNIEGLINAYFIMKRFGVNTHQLVIVGKRYSDYREPERLVEKLDLGSSVRFLENIPDRDLPLLYQAADVFVLLSFYEGFGLPVLEAMASNTPVVASNLTSLPEVVGDAGILVDPTNPQQVVESIQQVTIRGDKREQFITLGQQRACEFTWERCARETLALYREAISH
jgi:glycosyltransferase involved in cell wall biosynthesis